MQGTDPITYEYRIQGQRVEITRRHIGTAYARNGNVHNPTQYFLWDAVVYDERGVVKRPLSRHGYPQRADAYEAVRCAIQGVRYVNDDYRHKYVNVRPYTVVADEMKANYVGRTKATEK